MITNSKKYLVKNYQKMRNKVLMDLKILLKNQILKIWIMKEIQMNHILKKNKKMQKTSKKIKEKLKFKNWVKIMSLKIAKIAFKIYRKIQINKRK